MGVVVVGSINMDTTFRVPHIPIPGETIIAKNRQTSRGGKGQNQAVTLARLGTEVNLIGAVGKDDNGRSILKELSEDGVGTEYLYSKEGVTGLANIYVDDERNNNIVVYAGANYELTIEDIEKAQSLFDTAEYCVMQMEIPLDVIYYTLKLCKEKNVVTILNPAPANSEFDLEYLEYVDFLIPNESELELLTGEKLTDSNLQLLIDKISTYGCSNIIVTLGTDGSVLFNKDGSQKIAALKVQAVDTTAAGDSYIGALTTKLYEGSTIAEAMEFGSLVSAQTVTKRGAITSLPYRNEIDQLISTNEVN